MDSVTSYEFNVQVWWDEPEHIWNYSVVQEFENENSLEVEALGYGTADTYTDAFENAAEVIREFLRS